MATKHRGAEIVAPFTGVWIETLNDFEQREYVAL
jgi:hypothetical protein